VSEFLKALVAKLLGPREDDPLGEITADQLAIVLKSIEDKYTSLQDENARLHEKVEAQQREIARLTRALEESPRV
jgi:hypothetical protein